MLTLADRLQAVEVRISAACRRAGRLRSDVTLVAVTKSVTAEVAAQLHQLGVVHLAESRPQELWQKARVLPASVHWHLVGHLQRNKIERTLPLALWIHSVDSLHLLDALEQEAIKQQRSISVLLEINASRESQKHGFDLEDTPAIVPMVLALKAVHVCGLMTMAAITDNPEDARPTFGALRKLREELRPRLRAPHTMQHLSMGMSQDFDIAIEEGATMVRLGTVLFESVSGRGS